jgi:hypothetical protein
MNYHYMNPAKSIKNKLSSTLHLDDSFYTIYTKLSNQVHAQLNNQLINQLHDQLYLQLFKEIHYHSRNAFL